MSSDVHAAAQQLTELGARVRWEGERPVGVELSGSQQISNGVDWLTALPGLTHLELQFSDVTDEDLATIRQLHALLVLDLSGTQVSDLMPLAELEKLEWLDLSYTQVTDLAPLAGLPKLQMLYLGTLDGRITDQQVEDLQQALPNCEIHIE